MCWANLLPDQLPSDEVHQTTKMDIKHMTHWNIPSNVSVKCWPQNDKNVRLGCLNEKCV